MRRPILDMKAINKLSERGKSNSCWSILMRQIEVLDRRVHQTSRPSCPSKEASTRIKKRGSCEKSIKHVEKKQKSKSNSKRGLARSKKKIQNGSFS